MIKDKTILKIIAYIHFIFMLSLLIVLMIIESNRDKEVIPVEPEIKTVIVETLYVNRLSVDIANTIRTYSEINNVDYNFLVSIALVESSLNSKAYNKKNDTYGLFQLRKEDFFNMILNEEQYFDISLNTQSYIRTFLQYKGETSYIVTLSRMGKSSAYIDKVAEVYFLFSGNYLYNLN